MNAKVWACTSMGGCLTAFIIHAEPYFQVAACVVSIAAGIRAWIANKPK